VHSDQKIVKATKRSDVTQKGWRGVEEKLRTGFKGESGGHHIPTIPLDKRYEIIKIVRMNSRGNPDREGKVDFASKTTTQHQEYRNQRSLTDLPSSEKGKESAGKRNSGRAGRKVRTAGDDQGRSEPALTRGNEKWSAKKYQGHTAE